MLREFAQANPLLTSWLLLSALWALGRLFDKACEKIS